MSKPISVVIPNYNGRILLEKHLPAVIKAMRAGDELIVVDDASTDDSLRWLEKQVPTLAYQKEITFWILMNEKNLRFGASCNRGVTAASHEIIFLINSDVAPHADCVEPALAHFDKKDVFAVGCLEQERPDGKKIVQGGKNKLWFERGLFIHSRADDFTTGPTAWVSGGSGFFDKAKWLKIGGFDKLFYPAYWEDIDLSERARRRGWQVLFEAKSVVDHNHETTNQTEFGQQKINKISWGNMIKFTWRHANLFQRFQFLAWLPYHWWKMRGSI